MSYTMIEYEKSDRIATITLDRPEKYNTLRVEMWEELEDVVDLRLSLIVSGFFDEFDEVCQAAGIKSHTA